MFTNLLSHAETDDRNATGFKPIVHKRFACVLIYTFHPCIYIYIY